MSGISNADSSYRPLYLQREYKSGGGGRGGREGRAREHTTPRKRAVSLSLSLSLYELLFHGDDVHSRAVPFRPPDGRAAVADKLPHYAYAAYAPPKFAAGSPCSQPLKTLYFVRFLASFLTRYIYIYIYTSSFSPSFSRLLTYNVSPSLSLSLVSRSPSSRFPRASSTSRGQLPRTLYFLLPVPCGDFLERCRFIPRCTLYGGQARSLRLLFMEITLCALCYTWMEVD